MSFLVQLRRHNTSTPWGFRMNGGAEFAQPLYIQKVDPHSLAAKSGLRPGDGLIQIGQQPVQGMQHEQAKMVIIRAGNELDFIIQRDVVPVSPASEAHDKSRGPRAIMTEDTSHHSSRIPAQDPSVQSRSFKMLQQQLEGEG